MMLYDELIVGAIDLHCHIDLEFSKELPKRESEFVWLPKAEEMGMRGVVLKSHWWPTVNVVPYILASVETSVSLWSSVTMNPSVGGPHPCVIEACVAMGGQMVFLPTWSARNDIERKGFSHRIPPIYKEFPSMDNPGFVFTDEKGRLSPHGHELLECCRDHDLTLGTGHVSWQESLAFAQAARDLGFKKLVINHPLSHMIEAPVDALQRASELGAFVEACWNHLAPGRMSSPDLVEIVRSIGVHQVVVSTDYFRPYGPTPPELFRVFLGMLHEGGMSKEEIKLVACANPARAMGLE